MAYGVSSAASACWVLAFAWVFRHAWVGVGVLIDARRTARDVTRAPTEAIRFSRLVLGVPCMCMADELLCCIYAWALHNGAIGLAGPPREPGNKPASAGR